MANYYATIRTNYFSVKDEAKFKELMKKVNAEDEVHVFENLSPDGSKLFGFGCNGSIYGLPLQRGEDDCEDDMDCFLQKLQSMLSDDDAIIMTEVGYEKLRYVIGRSTVITCKDIRSISIPSMALELAQELLGNSDFQTQFEY